MANVNAFNLEEKHYDIPAMVFSKPHHKFWEMSELDLVLWIYSMKMWHYDWT
jgi:hypothetical protein